MRSSLVHPIPLASKVTSEVPGIPMRRSPDSPPCDRSDRSWFPNRCCAILSSPSPRPPCFVQLGSSPVPHLTSLIHPPPPSAPAEASAVGVWPAWLPHWRPLERGAGPRTHHTPTSNIFMHDDDAAAAVAPEARGG
ncbi:hypothetical protein BO71DRAFT_160824 [Aspergillus ellipticus CBS 707.79]|uniref:Uncharacterized protein n=1 Tax=Aspergillus ellipticus CBS 707.79 TaxID=1448320 RepID=A0A319DIQ2_9EURO|nr:hypothetical protein BO71DRAFT_160824 [Aspergillus ellipticus CBS 707.79]